MAAIEIRKAIPEDAFEYVLCNIACWREAYQGIMPDEYLASRSEDLAQQVEDYRRSLDEPESFLYFCVEDGDKMIGRLILCESRDQDKAGTGEVAAIYLRKEYWSKGYGRMMMDYAVDVLKGIGYQEVILCVLEENSRARRFYERYGFVHDGHSGTVLYGKALRALRYTMKMEDTKARA